MEPWGLDTMVSWAGGQKRQTGRTRQKHRTSRTGRRINDQCPLSLANGRGADGQCIMVYTQATSLVLVGVDHHVTELHMHLRQILRSRPSWVGGSATHINPPPRAQSTGAGRVKYPQSLKAVALGRPPLPPDSASYPF